MIYRVNPLKARSVLKTQVSPDRLRSLFPTFGASTLDLTPKEVLSLLSSGAAKLESQKPSTSPQGDVRQKYDRLVRTLSRASKGQTPEEIYQSYAQSLEPLRKSLGLTMGQVLSDLS